MTTRLRFLLCTLSALLASACWSLSLLIGGANIIPPIRRVSFLFLSFFSGGIEDRSLRDFERGRYFPDGGN